MAFSKTFPKTVKGSSYPRWEEVFLTEEEELLEEQKARSENIELIKQCIEDGKKIFQEKGLKTFQSDLIRVAVALFEKRASHAVYYKERQAKEKFDKK